MSSFVLTPVAVEDLREIASWLAEQAGEAVAERVENGLFASFQRLADTPGLGHRRSDLTKRPLVFFTINPYLIVYQRDISPIIIHAILHGARDVKRTLLGRASTTL